MKDDLRDSVKEFHVEFFQAGAIALIARAGEISAAANVVSITGSVQQGLGNSVTDKTAEAGGGESHVT